MKARQKYLYLKYIDDLGVRTIKTGTIEFLDIGIQNNKELVAKVSVYDFDKDSYVTKEIVLCTFIISESKIDRLVKSEKLIEYIILSMNKLGTKEYTDYEFIDLLTESISHLN